MRKLAKLLLATTMAVIMTGSVNAWFLDFEWGLGHDKEAIASIVPGVEFTTTDGQDWLYSDITTGGYNATNDLGDVYGSGIYHMYGNVSAWLGTDQGSGRMDFTNQDGSYFTIGYASQSTFYLEAYDAFDVLIDQEIGASNLSSPMNFLTVNSSSNNIAYIMIHDTGNYFTVDNMSGDATGVVSPSIPEPATMILVGLGLLGMGAKLRKRSK
jgi:hypothetical protein